MDEKAELIRRNGPPKSYGSVPNYHETDDEIQRPVRCLCTKRDTILILILSILIVAAIIASLSVGIPNIQQKKMRQKFAEDNLPLPSVDFNSLSNATDQDFSFISSENGTADVTKSTTSQVTTVTVEQVSNTAGVPLETIDVNTSAPRPLSAVFKRAAVSADDPKCADIGSATLQANGSAVDAAIATLLCLEVVNPQHSGIGGGFLMTLYSSKANTSYVIDARETAPAKSTQNMFQNISFLPSNAGLWMGVPGALKGYAEAHRRFGRMEWRQLFQPIIALCRNGYKVNKALAKALQTAKEYIFQEATLSELFVNNITGDVLKENDTLVRNGLADTFEKISLDGENTFYGGELGKQLIEEIQAAGGIITLDDLRNYTVKIKTPLQMQVATKYQFHSVPPPGSGALLGFILNILAGYDTNVTLDDDNTVTFLQRLVESYKFSFALRSQLGDDQFVNVSQLLRNLTSDSFASIIRSYIYDNMTFDPTYYTNKVVLPADYGTTHVNVFSPDGDVVAVTNTINSRFGAKLRSRALDIILNDEMADFSTTNTLPESSTNFIEPGKRPMSSMLPSILFDSSGEPLMAIGGSGGTSILTSVANVVVRYFVFNQCLGESVKSPRMHHELVPNILLMESTFPSGQIEAMSEIGHNVSVESSKTHVNTILRLTNGSLFAVSDQRIAEAVAGF